MNPGAIAATRGNGARSRNRTGTKSPSRDFKSLASTSSAIRAHARARLEARAGIEPTYTDLQSAASPLCHPAFGGCLDRQRRDVQFSRLDRRPEKTNAPDGEPAEARGKPGSNRRPQPWQGCALPTELFPREARILGRRTAVSSLLIRVLGKHRPGGTQVHRHGPQRESCRDE